MSQNAYARVKCKSNAHKKCYRNLDDAFGFKDSGALGFYIAENLANEILDVIADGGYPSIDRTNPLIGYVAGNLRVISFKDNTSLGVESRRTKVEVVFANGDKTYFKSVTKCAEHFGVCNNAICSWSRLDRKYKIPDYVAKVIYLK